MSGPAGSPAGNPALALVLALFMLGYILWTTDRLASLSRTSATATAHGTAEEPPATRAPVAPTTQGTPGPARTVPGRPEGRPALAPRLAACYKIAMSIGMGYMLILML